MNLPSPKNIINVTVVSAMGCILVSGCSLLSPLNIFSDKEKDNAQKTREANAEIDSRQTGKRPSSIYKPSDSENPNHAIELMRRRKFDEALKILDKYLAQNPRNAEAHSLKGDCLFQLMKFEEAEEAYNISRKIDPSYYPALLGTGIVKLNMAKELESKGEVQKAYENYTESLTILREANGILPGNMNASYGRAHAAAGIGNFFYQRALNLQRIRNDLQGAETMRDKTIECYKEALQFAIPYSSQFRRDIEARAFIATIHMRTAILMHEFKQTDLARNSLMNARITWQSILKEIDPKNTQAQEEIKKCTRMLSKWGAASTNRNHTDTDAFMER